jgi:hypothetical protein
LSTPKFDPGGRFVLNALATMRLCLTYAAAAIASNVVFRAVTDAEQQPGFQSDPPWQSPVIVCRKAMHLCKTLLHGIHPFAFTILIISSIHAVRVVIEIFVD